MAVIANITEFSVGTNGENVSVSNGTWTTSSSSPFGTANLKVTNSGTPNSVYNDSGNHSLAYLKPAGSTTQTVKLRIKRRSLTDGTFWHALVRVNGNNWIGAIFAGQDSGILGRISLNKCISGTRTNIGQSDDASRINSDGAEGTLEIRVSGEAPSIQVSAFWNDALVIGPVTVTDTSLNSVGSVGFQQRAFGPESQSTGFHVVSFYAEDGAPGGDTTAPTLTGSVSFASVTQTSYTASWPAGSDNVAVTGYEYQIGGTAGAWTNAGNSLSAAITGRTAGTTETVYVRAYDAAGNRSTPAISGSVTLASVATATITVGSALYPIKYSSASVLNETGLLATVLRADTLASVLTVSGVACNAGVITISNAALTAGTTYHLAVKTASGWTGLSDEVIAA